MQYQILTTPQNGGRHAIVRAIEGTDWDFWKYAIENWSDISARLWPLGFTTAQTLTAETENMSWPIPVEPPNFDLVPASPGEFPERSSSSSQV